VFAGQLPFEVTTADVQNLFSQYGELRSCQVVTGPDGRSKGCAMIMFNSWTEAELAIEGENNTTHLGGSKPMVVKFADPPKRGDGPIMGIAPKKLFVGQVGKRHPAGGDMPQRLALFLRSVFSHACSWPWLWESHPQQIGSLPGSQDDRPC